ncbi:MAG: cell filamentation protein Fic [Gammaproteobacteria bacterium]|nr:MAG: cell filamentation protein Fic [Gammaproteobacteria bacterium]
MKIEKPKEWSLLVDEVMEKYSPDELFQQMDRFKPIDEKGCYLHWDELRRRRDRYKKPDLAWLSIKSARRQISKNIPLKDIDGKPFSLCIPDSLQCLLHQIDKMAGGNISAVDSGIVNKDTQHRYLVQSLIMEEAITSAQLEGAATTRKVAKEMLETERAPRNKSERMILNNYRMMRSAVNAKGLPLSPELILNLHEIATDGAIDNDAEPGMFRQSDDIVVRYDGETVFTPPPAKTITKRITELCEFAAKDHSNAEADEFIHPVVKATILHFMIGYIHPFGDGNGRAARALFYWFMLKSGYWLFEYISISQLLRKAPAQYVKSYVYTETDDQDMTYFIDYQIHIIHRAINELIAYLKEKQQSYYDFMTLLEDSGFKSTLQPRQLDILKKACREPGRIFKATVIKNEYSVSLNTARSDLEKIAKLKFLVQFKEGRELLYVAPSDLLEKITRSK